MSLCIARLHERSEGYSVLFLLVVQHIWESVPWRVEYSSGLWTMLFFLLESEAAMLWGYGYGWTGMLWMGLGTLFWITVLVLAIWFLARLFMGRAVPLPSGRPPMPPSAMEILRQRYARGEIDTETFVTMRNQLEASANGAASSQNLYERGSEPLMPLSDT